MIRFSRFRFASLMVCTVLLGGCNYAPSNSTSSRDSQSPASQYRVSEPPFSRAEASPGGRPDWPEQGGREPGRRRSRRARPAANNQPGAFDFYLLTLSWSPEFCATHPGSEECGAHPGFVLHGLWPQNDDATYPENCSDAAGPSDPQKYTSVIPTVSLVEHEWKTHGTCSGLAPDAYFNEAVTAFHSVRIPATFVNDRQPISLTPGDIVGQFTGANPGLPQGSVTISCGNNDLTAVGICLSKTLTPEVCQNVHTCGARVVKVTPR